MVGAGIEPGMPPTLEAVCNNPGCELDMFEVHYSYEMAAAEVGIEDFVCPYCGEAGALEELFYTYRDSR